MASGAGVLGTLWARAAAVAAGGSYDSDPDMWNAKALADAAALVEGAGDGKHLSYAGEVRIKGQGVSAFDRVSIEAIYGTIGTYHSRQICMLGNPSRLCVTRLAISFGEHDRALSLIQTRGRRAAAVDSNSDSTEDEGEGGDQGATVMLRHGRRVADHRGKSYRD